MDSFSFLQTVQYTVFPRMIAGAIISFFAPKGGDYSREGDYFTEAISSNIVH